MVINGIMITSWFHSLDQRTSNALNQGSTLEEFSDEFAFFMDALRRTDILGKPETYKKTCKPLDLEEMLQFRVKR